MGQNERRAEPGIPTLYGMRCMSNMYVNLKVEKREGN